VSKTMIHGVELTGISEPGSGETNPVQVSFVLGLDKPVTQEVIDEHLEKWRSEGLIYVRKRKSKDVSKGIVSISPVVPEHVPREHLPGPYQLFMETKTSAAPKPDEIAQAMGLNLTGAARVGFVF
jgi:hypothetical protein